jgi:hypothetical protein
MYPSSFVRRALTATLVALLLPVAAQAIDFGIRGGVYTDVEEPFFGVELLMPVGSTGWFFNPNVEWVAVSDGDLATVNADFHYDLPVDPVYVWVGGGPAVIFRDPPGRRTDDETDVGANLLVGVGWKNLSVVPYAQAKIVISDESEVVAAVGVRF